MMVLNAWKRVHHPNIIALRNCYLSNGAVFFVHDFYPTATSLYDCFLNVLALFPPFSLQNILPGSAPLLEDLLWCIAIQLLSALQTIHAYNLACRTMDCRHVLMTERNCFRVGSVGVMDILEPHSTNQDLQAKDLYQLGSLLVLLGCRGAVFPDIKTLAVHYSDKLVNVVQLLLAAQIPASAVLEQCTLQIVKTLNSSLSTCDTYYNDLVRASLGVDS